jgi:hypothetical protein
VFAWLSCYRRLNTIFERTKEQLVAFVEIAFISILSRRMNCLVANELRAWHPQTASKNHFRLKKCAPGLGLAQEPPG